MITDAMAEKALAIYYALYKHKVKPPRKGTKEYNRQVNCLGAVLEGIRPMIEEAHLERLIAQAKGKIVPFRNPLTGTWTKREDKTGKFVEVKTESEPFTGKRGQK